MTSSHDESLAQEFSARRAEAEAFLRREMEKLGLHARDGWTITEITRERDGGSEIVLRPLHREKQAPEGLECVVRILEVAPKIDTECKPPQRQDRA